MNGPITITTLTTAIAAAFAALVLAGCAETTRGQEPSFLPPGQAVQVRCRFPDGKVGITGIEACNASKGTVVP